MQTEQQKALSAFRLLLNKAIQERYVSWGKLLTSPGNALKGL